METGYHFSRGLDHASIVAASERVAWTVDEVFRGRQFDASRPLVPASWVGTQALELLGWRGAPHPQPLSRLSATCRR